MSLLRIKFEISLRAWDEDSPSFQEISDKWFDDKPDEQVSLYEATTSAEEVAVVAAFSLTNLKTGIKPAHLMRIEWADLAAVGIHASNIRLGNTGVVAVDFRHWEIPAERKPIRALLERIWGLTMLGEDRFRWVGKMVQAAAMNRFLGAEARSVIDEAKRCCLCKLKNQTGCKRPLGRAIRDELQETRPAIPEQRIRLLAGENWLQRMAVGMAGDAEQDWLSAEQNLRQLYEHELLQYTQEGKPTR